MSEYLGFIKNTTNEFLQMINNSNSEESIRWLNTNLINYEDWKKINNVK